MSAGAVPAGGWWGRAREMNLAQRLRLISGLTMFTFVSTHLLNHSLGLVSLDVMVAGQRWFFWFWHNPVVTATLLTAFCTHLTLVLYKQIVRPTLRMPWLEGLRIVLGLCTLCALSFHATHQLTARLVNGAPVRYPDFLVALAAGTPLLINQLTLVTCAWSHGCMGLHLWLRIRAGYRKNFPWLVALAVLVPTLALLGVLSGAREAKERLEQAGETAGGGYGSSSYGASGYGSSSDTSSGYGSSSAGSAGTSAYGDATGGKPGGEAKLWGAPRISVYGLGTALAAIVLALLARLGVGIWRRRHGRVFVRYPGGRQFAGPRGASVLDISRMARVPHAAVCGGRGRCSTCRVHVDAGWDALPPPQDLEARVLARIRAPARVRLACQVRPLQDVAVTPLVPANARPRDALPYDRHLFGAELEIVILFADLRGFTKMSESKLPYDVVHILNAYFAEMGAAIEGAGGYLDKFIGDGIMALFGLSDGVEAGARHALAAARAMGERLGDLNRRLALDLPAPLRLGIGIHVGHVIVGEMGYKRATSLTAIGDSVNVASRLESETKAAQCQLLVSAEVARRAGVDLAAFPLQQIQVRGREESLSVHAVGDAAQLPVTADPAAPVGGGVTGGVAR